MTPDQRANRAADAMQEGDRATPWFGIERVSVAEGRAIFALTVAEHHLNGHDICHGGVIFALADSAFAFACNSRNSATVAYHNSITYLAPGHLGDRLTAEAEELQLQGRNGITDVAVTNQKGTCIARFRGLSRATGGRNFEE
ncbi:MAG: hydroxyphenylacetyl-CoA thioesterase PaaI [Pseudomonadota bacterium]